MKVRLEFKLEDFWVGVYWRKSIVDRYENWYREQLDIWVCIVPCFPIHITWQYYDYP